MFSDGAYEVTTRDGRDWTLEEFLDLLTTSAVSEDGSPKRIERGVRRVMEGDVFEDDFSLLVTAFH